MARQAMVKIHTSSACIIFITIPMEAEISIMSRVKMFSLPSFMREEFNHGGTQTRMAEGTRFRDSLEKRLGFAA